MSRRRAATSLATGLVLLVIAPLVWWITQPTPAGQTVSDVNAAAAAELASPTPVFSGAPGSVGPNSISSADPAPNAAAASQLAPQPANAEPATVEPSTVGPSSVESSTVAADPVAPPVAVAASAPAPAAPVRVALPALGVDASIVPVGVEADGQLEIPKDVSTVGWYRFGPAPGAAAGSAVLTGHVDDVNQGVGVFGRIGDLGPGDAVTVTDEAGTARNYTVLSREEWNKSEVPLDRLFDRAGEPRLVLITCGGTFDDSTLGYDDNIAITAVPAAG
jgi:hypothetical protein